MRIGYSVEHKYVAHVSQCRQDSEAVASLEEWSVHAVDQTLDSSCAVLGATCPYYRGRHVRALAWVAPLAEKQRAHSCGRW
jgi:hypothetical protein